MLKQQPAITFDVVEIENPLKMKNPAWQTERRAGRSISSAPLIKRTNLTSIKRSNARPFREPPVCSVVSSLKEVTGKENGMTGLRLTDFICYAQVLSDLHTALDIRLAAAEHILGVSRGVIEKQGVLPADHPVS